MPARRVREFLDGHNVKYVTMTHSKAYTAQEIAATAHIPGKELAKTVMVMIDDRMAMTVLPASTRLDLEHLKSIAGAKRVELASEREFRDLFPECEAGAMPPFGNLYGMDVWVDAALAEDELIAFNAGSHTELIRMSFRDFRKLVAPKIVEISRASLPV